jgi:hypothetical protein
MPLALGRIVGSISARRYRVRLDDGADIEALLTSGLLHKLGCVFGRLQDGLAVRVSLHDPPKQHKIIDVTNPRFNVPAR